MAEKFVAKLAEFQDGDRRIVFVGDNEIGVFRHDGQFYAYSNFCLHQGGPACEGLTIAKVEERLRPDKTSMGLFFSENEMHFVCPWHGMEYDMTTGECVSDRKMKLKKYKTVQKERTFMSSPKRAPKVVAKAAAKTVRRPAAISTATQPESNKVDGASADANRMAAVLERGIVDGKLDVVTTEALQKLIAAACRVYTARVEAGEQFTPVPRNSISATDVMVTASGLLKAADLAVFELGMWQSWTGR